MLTVNLIVNRDFILARCPASSDSLGTKSGNFRRKMTGLDLCVYVVGHVSY